ncbi:hypothetical protein [Candidatus Microthrix parvicella]|uniref:hypothetical protein n=1 Tax=Candidatus Neomicrothrix parvicella TaxID=41950 RepID=UPI000367AB2A|nr:hypothetical protein [Candidatus Microthrix parvicella]
MWLRAPNHAQASIWLDDLRSVAGHWQGQLPARARRFVVYIDHVGYWEELGRDVPHEPTDL